MYNNEKESHKERATSLQPTRKYEYLELPLTVLSWTPSCLSPSPLSELPAELSHVKCCGKKMKTSGVANCIAPWEPACFPSNWKIARHMHVDGNAGIAGGRTWKFPRELYLLPFQDHSCPCPAALRGPRARQSPAAGAARWGWGRLRPCDSAIKD